MSTCVGPHRVDLGKYPLDPENVVPRDRPLTFQALLADFVTLGRENYYNNLARNRTCDLASPRDELSPDEPSAGQLRRLRTSGI